jgi:hypothetical protein
MARVINRREYFLQLVNTRTKRPIDDDSGDYQVYQPNTPVRQTIYSAAGATLTQEVTATAGVTFVSRDMTDGQIHFFTNMSASSVDITVLTAGGRAYFLQGITPSQHRVDVNPEEKAYQLVVAVNDKASSTLVRTLGLQLRKGMSIKDVVVRVSAAFTGALTANNNIDIGRSGDADGFADALRVSSVGFKYPVAIISTTGLGAQRHGADLVKVLGFSSTGTANVIDAYIRLRYMAQTGVASNNLVIKRGAALTASVTGANAAAGKAYICYEYELLPVAAAPVM